MPAVRGVGAVSAQLDLEGGETLTVDPRVERAARALWDRDARRGLWGQPQAWRDGLWLRVRPEYVEAARAALEAAGPA